MAVEHGAVDSVGRQVDVGIRAGQRLELHGGCRAEGLLAGNQVKLDHIAIDGDQCRALNGFIAGQIR